jgi:hypothetical protein
VTARWADALSIGSELGATPELARASNRLKHAHQNAACVLGKRAPDRAVDAELGSRNRCRRGATNTLGPRALSRSEAQQIALSARSVVASRGRRP